MKYRARIDFCSRCFIYFKMVLSNVVYVYHSTKARLDSCSKFSHWFWQMRGHIV